MVPMIISASRRTDIPAFYSRWLINRLHAGFCWVPNPFNPARVAEISLLPEQVDAIVFWTRNPRPLFPFLPEIKALDYRYYFQFTLLDYPTIIDQHNPPAQRSLATFRSLADFVGPQCVIWRYDPIVLSEITPPDFHRETYARLAETLRGYTMRSVISFLDVYPKLRRRINTMASRGARLLSRSEPSWCSSEGLSEEQTGLARDLAVIAANNGMEILSCAEEGDLSPFGVKPGKCIDDELLSRVFGLDVSHLNDPGQRKACGCVVSKDIGMYDTCLFGCQYCYATNSFERARENYHRHRPDSRSLL
jgi:hypothetical protein